MVVAGEILPRRLFIEYDRSDIRSLKTYLFNFLIDLP